VTALGNLLRPIFGVSQEFTTLREEDYQPSRRLKTVVRAVTKGCQITLQSSNFQMLVQRLDEFDIELRGYAYEGAGIGLAAVDSLLPWGNRTRAFLDGPGSAFIYAVPLGAGMGLARLHRNPERFRLRLDPVLGWLIFDGYGFHEGFFASRRALHQQRVPGFLSPYGRRVFDHGLGRSIWFTSGTDVASVVDQINTFPKARRADLWSGVGLACGYTGGADRIAIEALKNLVGEYAPQLAMGVAIAANARHTVGNPSSYVELACEELCGMSSDEASVMVDVARTNLPDDGEQPAYEIWRSRLVERFSSTPTQEMKL
jgi:enediyne biosynthesis protein E3